MTFQFYIVPTPIGNLSDITYRAIDILKKVDCIACEDTRVTRILAEKYNIGAKLTDCHKFNEKERSNKIINLLKEGKTVALVSDAGTPCISDPGCYLIEALIENNIKYTALPGACAVTTFLSQIPRNTEEFAFIGFIPKTKNRQKLLLDKYKYINTVFYESPNRLLNTLNNIKEFYGENIKIAVGRELTKIFEEIKIDDISHIIDYYENNTLKGEIAVMLFALNSNDVSEEFLNDKIEALKEGGFSPKDISKIISKLYNMNKNQVYKKLID